MDNNKPHDSDLYLRNLSVSYQDKDVLFDINLTLSAGQITVIVGPNGCGKSTLLKTLCGILPVRSGDILIKGRSIRTYSAQALARQISYLPQNRQIPDISVERMVLHGRFPYLSYPRRYRPADLEIAHQAMERMGIADLAETSMTTLSGGTRQKVYLAMALAQDTPIILLDEPTTYLDIAHQLQTMEHARFLCREGKTVVMVLHDLPLALKLADQLVVMHQGRIAASKNPEELYASRCLDDVFGVRLCRVQTPEGWQYYTV